MTDRSEFDATSTETLTPVVHAWDLPPNPYWENLEARRQRKSLAIAILLFVLTLISTLAVGAQYASSYSAGQSPDFDELFSTYASLLAHPQLLLAGVPFAFTLIGILLAHELGHFFACRYYGISASYPYFLPAPTLIGTLGAFIRIRSPIHNRKALFDMALAGPVVGFLFAVPSLAIAILYSRVVPLSDAHATVVFGQPIVMRLLVSVLRPDVSAGDLLLHPVGRAAWVGLFATALNLLPGGQLDGRHILYSVASKVHKKITPGRGAAPDSSWPAVLEGMDHVGHIAAGHRLPPSAAAQSMGAARSYAPGLGRGCYPDFYFVFHAHAGHDPLKPSISAGFSLRVLFLSRTKNPQAEQVAEILAPCHSEGRGFARGICCFWEAEKKADPSLRSG